MTVGHLSMETYRVVKFLLDPGTRVFAILTSTNYYISSLNQGALGIPYRVEIHLALTVRNKELIRIYKSSLDALYYEWKEANALRIRRSFK